jgi:prepilin-type processing-associated H-X9-DG protein
MAAARIKNCFSVCIKGRFNGPDCDSYKSQKTQFGLAIPRGPRIPGFRSPSNFSVNNRVHSAIQDPSETIAFGEKEENSGDFLMDLRTYNEATVLDQTRHGAPGAAGGANYGFADGSVRFLKFGRSLQPVNLWGLTPAVRNTR